MTRDWFKFLRLAIELLKMAIAKIMTDIKIQNMIGMKRIVDVGNGLVIFMTHIMQ
jgi:hypothetical protein